MARYGMVIDIKQCEGCMTCMMVCKSENNLPNGVWWNRMLTDGGGAMDAPGGVYPNVHREFYTVACQHCDNPACTKVCPVGATFKDADTGVVRQDYDKCIGCRMCMAACPYTGVRSFMWEAPKYYFDIVCGDKDSPAHQKHVVEKCTMCWHRIARGDTPACVLGCPADARFWGDLDDPKSEVSKLIATRQWKQLLPEKGTRPSVYYLV